jgi:ABC-2 type transport system ATP-binding protein
VSATETATVAAAQGAAYVVVAEGVSKWYGQVIGLNDVSVHVPSGVTGLLGPNGAGKSTFMKLITGQLRPSQGTLRVLGESAWDNPPLYFRVGFCPEQDSFYERMTGLEWVATLLQLNGLPEREATATARRALETVDLHEAADKKIGASASSWLRLWRTSRSCSSLMSLSRAWIPWLGAGRSS